MAVPIMHVLDQYKAVTECITILSTLEREQSVVVEVNQTLSGSNLFSETTQLHQKPPIEAGRDAAQVNLLLCVTVDVFPVKLFTYSV